MKYKETNWSVYAKCDSVDEIEEEKKEEYLIENGYCPICKKSTEEAIGNYYANTFLCPDCCEEDWEVFVKNGAIESEGESIWAEIRDEFIKSGVSF